MPSTVSEAAANPCTLLRADSSGRDSRECAAHGYSPYHLTARHTDMDAARITRPTLLARVQRADDDAWLEFAGIYGSLIIRYCRRSGLQLADAEDICQIILAKLARALSPGHPDAPV